MTDTTAQVEWEDHRDPAVMSQADMNRYQLGAGRDGRWIVATWDDGVIKTGTATDLTNAKRAAELFVTRRMEHNARLAAPTEQPKSDGPAIDPETNLGRLVAFKRLTGLTLRITPFDSIDVIDVQSPTTIMVSITVHTVDERKSEFAIKARGTRLIGFQKSPAGVWRQMGRTITAWDDDLVPFTVPMFGPGKTPGEWLAAKEFARMCYRPGSSAQPMDSSYRVNAAPEYTTVRMVRHWN